MLAVADHHRFEQPKQHASQRVRLLPPSALPPANSATDFSDQLFCLSGCTVDTVCTALDRSLVAAVPARRLCQAAANVFDKEAKAISDAKVTIMNALAIPSLLHTEQLCKRVLLVQSCAA